MNARRVAVRSSAWLGLLVTLRSVRRIIDHWRSSDVVLLIISRSIKRILVRRTWSWSGTFCDDRRRRLRWKSHRTALTNGFGNGRTASDRVSYGKSLGASKRWIAREVVACSDVSLAAGDASLQHGGYIKGSSGTAIRSLYNRNETRLAGDKSANLFLRLRVAARCASGDVEIISHFISGNIEFDVAVGDVHGRPRLTDE